MVKRLLGSALVLVVLGGAASAGTKEEQEKIEQVIAAVVEAYHTGDYAGMGHYYAADVTMVPGDYAPPLVGWTSVERRYQVAHANLSGLEVARENTQIVVRGKLAWATYQWRFAGRLGSEAISALGHTTLILEKRQGRWVIVHNHTSALLPLPSPEKPAAGPPSS
ncbi:MAG: nuclear transport factor 2 family protein [Acidobacteria bacterium]|nr:nuclear transport factor 2 family protein [Acidobacteriota bacterium]